MWLNTVLGVRACSAPRFARNPTVLAVCRLPRTLPTAYIHGGHRASYPHPDPWVILRDLQATPKHRKLQGLTLWCIREVKSAVDELEGSRDRENGSPGEDFRRWQVSP